MGFKGGGLGKLNAFPRAEEHLTQKTASGAAVTIVGAILMVILFLHEVEYQLSIRTVHEMSVDQSRSQKLPIHINITFPALPCKVLSLDAIDMSGKHEVDLDTNIWKLRVNKDGYIIGSEFVSDLVEGEHKSEEDKMEAHGKTESDEHQDDHDGHGNGPKLFGDPQKMLTDIKTALENHEGCRKPSYVLPLSLRGIVTFPTNMFKQVYGVLDVERVAGNFHVSMHGLSVFIAQQVFERVSDVNVSHVIHDLSFGPIYPGVHNPLDGTSRILKDTSGTFKYFLKVVPTEYRFLNGMVMPTNQFSVGEYFMSTKFYDRSWPAVFFVYDLSPISVTIREERHHFGHFLTRVSAVLGGTFALTGLLDRWIYSLIERVTGSNQGRRIGR